MSFEVGAIVEGTVTGITSFGAFVDLADNKVGLVHISEVSAVYVKDVHDFLKEGDKVKVKILTIDGKGKVGLSIKQAQPPVPRPESFEQSSPAMRPRPSVPAPRVQQGAPAMRPPQRIPLGQNTGHTSFEDKVSRFLKDSDDRLTDLKKNTESKRGGRGAGRRG